MYYAGVTKQQLSKRWQPSRYENCQMFFRKIEEYGWDNIEHAVIVDGLERADAKKIEDKLICFYRSIGQSLNIRRSGLIYEDKEYISEYNKTYHKEHSGDIYLRKKMYRKNNAEKCREQAKNYRHSNCGKIYYRVFDLNRRHPDRAVETPMEAKLKYLDSGYIPQYIKHDDIDGPAE